MELMTERFGVNTDQCQQPRNSFCCTVDTTGPDGDIIFFSPMEVASLGHVSQKDTQCCLNSLLKKHRP